MAKSRAESQEHNCCNTQMRRKNTTKKKKENKVSHQRKSGDGPRMWMQRHGSACESKKDSQRDAWQKGTGNGAGRKKRETLLGTKKSRGSRVWDSGTSNLPPAKRFPLSVLAAFPGRVSLCVVPCLCVCEG